MNTRAFDPALLGAVDQCTLGEEDAGEIVLVETCTICGAQDLVFEIGTGLVDLNGNPHECPEV